VLVKWKTNSEGFSERAINRVDGESATTKGRTMKKMAQVAVIGALIALGATGVNAQTNIDLNVNIALSGVVQTGDTATKGRIGTKDVIAALGGSTKAKLLLRFSPDGGEPVFVLRDGTTDTVVATETLSTSSAGNAVTVTTDRNGVTAEKTVEIRAFHFASGTIGFDVQGYTTSSADNKGNHGEIFGSTSVVSASAKVSGNMTDSAGNPGVCQGTISVSGRKITETAIP
jgi:hypothetical protein